MSVSTQHCLKSCHHAMPTSASLQGSQESRNTDAADMRLLSSQYFNQGVMNGYCGRHYQGFRRQSNSLIPVIVQVCCARCGGGGGFCLTESSGHDKPLSRLFLTFKVHAKEQDGARSSNNTIIIIISSSRA